MLLRKLYGSQSRSARKDSGLPRRNFPRPEKPGLKMFRSKRAKQRAELQGQEPLDDNQKMDELAQLEDVAKKEARKRKTSSQESFTSKLQQYANKKRKDMLLDARASNLEIVKKLLEHKERAARNLERIKGLGMRSMAVQLDKEPLPMGTIVIGTQEDALQAVTGAGGQFRLWPSDDNSDAAVAVAKEALEAPAVVWLSSSEQEEQSMLFVSSPEEWTTFNGVVRILGGFVVGPYWHIGLDSSSRRRS